jgi:hypothetical protein
MTCHWTRTLTIRLVFPYDLFRLPRRFYPCFRQAIYDDHLKALLAHIRYYTRQREISPNGEKRTLYGPLEDLIAHALELLIRKEKTDRFFEAVNIYNDFSMYNWMRLISAALLFERVQILLYICNQTVVPDHVTNFLSYGVVRLFNFGCQTELQNLMLEYIKCQQKDISQLGHFLEATVYSIRNNLIKLFRWIEQHWESMIHINMDMGKSFALHLAHHKSCFESPEIIILITHCTRDVNNATSRYFRTKYPVPTEPVVRGYQEQLECQQQQKRRRRKKDK